MSQAEKIYTMTPQLSAKLEEVRAARNFDPAKWVDEKCEMLNEYMRRCGLKGVVINVSGGIDSAVTLLLAKKASELPNSPIKKIIPITQPIHSTESIWSRALELCKSIGTDIKVIDQTEVFDLLHTVIDKALGMEPNAFAQGQLKSYMRTPPAFYIAQVLSCQGFPAIVLGTGNYDEDGYLYYFCKAGDGTSDVQLIHDLHKSEVFKVAAHLKCVDSVLTAPPSADLWPGQTDENEMGFPYDFAELYIELLHNPDGRDEWIASLDEENRAAWDAMAHKVEQIHRRNSHKAVWPLNLDICCPSGKQYQFC